MISGKASWFSPGVENLNIYQADIINERNGQVRPGMKCRVQVPFRIGLMLFPNATQHQIIVSL